MKMINCVAYVAGPYRAPTERQVVENIRAAEAVALELWKRRIPTICPHLNTALLGGAAPDDVWLKGDLVMLKRCDVIVMVEGWDNSSGAKAELEAAQRWGKTAHFPRSDVRITLEQQYDRIAIELRERFGETD